MERHVSDADKSKARKWFERAKAVADTRNYEYAIEAYIGGLKLWPDAVEEGHKPLRVVATARKMAGKKGLGFLESRKHGTSGKDALQNMLNAEFLWAYDPGNVSHMEAFIINAARAGANAAAAWMAPICVEALLQEKKVPVARYQALWNALDAAGEAASHQSQYAVALEAFNNMTRIATLWQQQHKSAEAAKAVGDAQSKLTIVKGRFDSDKGFTESIRDKASQDDLRDKDRLVQAEDRLSDLIDKARAEYEADRQSVAKLNAYVDLLTRRESEPEENLAIDVLEQAYVETKNYSIRVRADDIRIKQLNRAARHIVARAKADPENAAIREEARQHRRKQLDFEIQVFEERIRQYPTDLRVRFALAERYFKDRRLDDAIPLFQQAQNDGRHRAACRLYLGRCFFDKSLFAEACNILRKAIEAHEGGGDDTGKQLYYWLGRALEADDHLEEAGAAYGQLIQWDYNYLDARARLEQLRKKAG